MHTSVKALIHNKDISFMNIYAPKKDINHLYEAKTTGYDTNNERD